MRPALYLCAMCVLFTFGLRVSLAEGVPSSVRNRLVDMWAAERTAVVTGHFRFRFIRLAGTRLAGLSVDELEHVVDSVDLTASLDQMKHLFDRISSTPDPSSTPWSVATLDVEGDRFREEHHVLLGTKQVTLTGVYNGSEKVDADGINNQVTIARGKTQIKDMSVSDLRFIPVVTELAPDEFSVAKEPNGRVLVTAGSSTLSVDEATGFAYRFVGRSTEGRVTSEILQYGPVSYPGGIVFPTASVKIACYTNGKISRVQIVVMEEVILNQPVKDETFQVAAAKGAVIVDATKSRDVPNVFRLPKDVSDVVADARDKAAEDEVASHETVGATSDEKPLVAQRGAAENAIQSHERDNRWMRLLWPCLIFLLLAVAFYLWRRRVGAVRRPPCE
jgi:hypothetical protein